jgi:hypothetical protein
MKKFQAPSSKFQLGRLRLLAERALMVAVDLQSTDSKQNGRVAERRLKPSMSDVFQAAPSWERWHPAGSETAWMLHVKIQELTPLHAAGQHSLVIVQELLRFISTYL